MNKFVLVDGAMAYGTVSTRPIFKAPDAEWLVALMPHEAQRLAGPLLLDTARIDSMPAVVAEAQRVVAAFPLRLHLSVIESDLALKELAEHLRRFIHFSDDQGETYGLRIADCRVLAYLPQILSAEQWDALAAPIERWSIHDRTGKQRPLALNDTRHAHQTAMSTWHLDADQIERLIDAGEADALLALLSKLVKICVTRIGSTQSCGRSGGSSMVSCWPFSATLRSMLFNAISQVARSDVCIWSRRSCPASI